MSAPIPRRATDLRTALQAISDLQDFARLQPAVEFKTFDCMAGVLSESPIEVRSQLVPRPLCVSLALVVQRDAPETPLVPTGFHWRPGKGQGVVLMDGLYGLDTGTVYTVTLKIEGTR